MNQIPLSPIPNQRLTIDIEGNQYAITINTRNEKLYITIIVNGITIMSNRALLSYAPLTDKLMMIDTEGLKDPTYDGLGSRYLLVLWEVN